MAKETTPNFLFNAIRDQTDLYTPLNIRGKAPVLTTAATPATVWDGNNLYIFPASANWEIVSDSANDTGAGTGVQTVEIEFLDNDCNQLGSEGITTVTLNGLTPVAITEVDGAKRCNSLVAISSGSLNTNEGTITVREVGNPTNIIAQMNPSTSNAMPGFYTVPNGFVLYVKDITISSNRGGTGGGDREADVDIVIFEEGGNTARLVLSQNISQFHNFAISVAVPLLIKAKTDIQFVVTNLETNNTEITCLMLGLLERL